MNDDKPMTEAERVNRAIGDAEHANHLIKLGDSEKLIAEYGEEMRGPITRLCAAFKKASAS